MLTQLDRWNLFNIRVFTDVSVADARRVVFEFRNSKSHPATVLLRAGGEMVVRFLPPEPEVPGFTRDDFVTKAVAMVQWTDRATQHRNPN